MPRPTPNHVEQAHERLLDVVGMSVTFDTDDGPVQVVRDVSFSLDAGRTLAIVGESGSGKSVTSQALIGLLGRASVAGQAFFQGRDLFGLTEAELREVRGRQIGMIFQDPLTSLHPYYRVGHQIVETIRAHEKVSRNAAASRAIELMRRVGIPDPERNVDAYPHQLSGGMRQRVMIGLALALRPRLLIADEPTTALDVTMQAQILELMSDLQSEFGTAIVIITHDLGVVSGMADDVLVMYSGGCVETAPAADLFARPVHPYTQGLLESMPSFARRRGRLRSIPGNPPVRPAAGPGCAFAPRCRHAVASCWPQRPVLQAVEADDRHRAACPVMLTALHSPDTASPERKQAQ